MLAGKRRRVLALEQLKSVSGHCKSSSSDGRDGLHHQSKNRKEASKDNWKTISTSKLQRARSISSRSRRRTLLSRLALRTILLRRLLIATPKARISLRRLTLLLRIRTRRRRRPRRSHARSSRSNVHARRISGTAWVVLAAGRLAQVVGGVAAAHAVLLPVLADVVGHGDGVFGHVGRVAVAAFALVGESLLQNVVSIVFEWLMLVKLTGSQVLALVTIVPSSCPQSCGQTAVWSEHHVAVILLVYAFSVLFFFLMKRTLGLEVNSLWVNPVLALSLSGGGEDGHEAGDLESQHVEDMNLKIERLNECNVCISSSSQQLSEDARPVFVD